jgi:hypothetical protein
MSEEVDHSTHGREEPNDNNVGCDCTLGPEQAVCGAAGCRHCIGAGVHNARFKACTACQKYRALGLFHAALACRSCDGKGAVRTGASYVCNMCGESPCIDSEYPQGLIEARVGGSYSSFHLMDMTSYIFTICEKCLRTKLFPSFVVVPDVFDRDFWGGYETTQQAYARDLAAYEARVWLAKVRTVGNEDGSSPAHTKLLTGQCNQTEQCDSPALWRSLTSRAELGWQAVCDKHAAAVSLSNRLTPVSSVPQSVQTEEDRERVRLAWEGRARSVC